MVISEKLSRISPIARAILVIGAVAALVTSVTLAAWVDSATLTANSVALASADADLKIWDGDSFEDTAPGVDFGVLEPGVESEKQEVLFQNDGNVPLYLTAALAEDAPDLPEGIEGTEVLFKFYGECAAEEATPTSATWAQLLAGEVDLPCDPLELDAEGAPGEEGNEGNYAVTVTIADSVEPGEEDTEFEDFTLLFNAYTEDADTGGEPEPAIAE